MPGPFWHHKTRGILAKKRFYCKERFGKIFDLLCIMRNRQVAEKNSREQSNYEG